MKNAEDEAFEDIERRQGGGFPAKRAAATDKLQEEDWGALAEKQLASIKRDTRASFEGAMVRATHKVMAEFEAQPAQEPMGERAWFTIAELNAWADKKLAENPDWVMPTDEPEREALAQPAQSMKVEGPLHVVCQCDKCKAQPAQEPVAHVYLFDHDGRPRVAWDNAKGIQIGDNLYTYPPKREWVGLTDEELADCLDMSIQKTCRAIEAKLKERNS